MEFKQFDVAMEAPKDHHYLDSNNISNPSTPLNYRRLIREWKIMKTNLPESIYVQVYGTRMDLLRAVIIGYHDALFFFDIALPSDYPNQPPKLYFCSHGHGLNPSLDEVQQFRRGSQTTILEVLVSIQSFYFDCPEFETGRNVELCWKAMVQMIRKPPMNFERFVVEHFRGRAPSILAAIEHYEKRHVVLNDSTTPISSSQHQFPTFGISLPNTNKDEAINKAIQKWTRAIIKVTRHVQKSVTGAIISFPMQIQKHLTGDDWMMIAFFVSILSLTTITIRSDISITYRSSYSPVVEEEIGDLMAGIDQHIGNLTAGIQQHIENFAAGGIEQIADIIAQFM